MEENKKLAAVALVVLLGGNAGSFVSAFNPNAGAAEFTSLDAAMMRAEILHDIAQRGEANEREHTAIDIRLTVAEFLIKDCVRKVGP